MQQTRREVRNLIGGEWLDCDGRETETVYDPATSEVIAETPFSTKEDVDRAVKAAEAALEVVLAAYRSGKRHAPVSLVTGE